PAPPSGSAPSCHRSGTAWRDLLEERRQIARLLRTLERRRGLAGVSRLQLPGSLELEETLQQEGDCRGVVGRRHLAAARLPHQIGRFRLGDQGQDRTARPHVLVELAWNETAKPRLAMLDE